jgi:hypothetical protein
LAAALDSQGPDRANRSRGYFGTVSLGEPGGALFKIATDARGFGLDELMESAGKRDHAAVPGVRRMSAEIVPARAAARMKFDFTRTPHRGAAQRGIFFLGATRATFVPSPKVARREGIVLSSPALVASMQTDYTSRPIS